MADGQNERSRYQRVMSSSTDGGKQSLLKMSLENGHGIYSVFKEVGPCQAVPYYHTSPRCALNFTLKLKLVMINLILCLPLSIMSWLYVTIYFSSLCMRRTVECMSKSIERCHKRVSIIMLRWTVKFLNDWCLHLNLNEWSLHEIFLYYSWAVLISFISP